MVKGRNMKRFSFLIALAFAALCLTACSNMFAGTSDDPNQVTASVNGVVEKGPFVKGTTVTLYELNPETFAQTGKVFTGSVDGDDGSFSLGKVELGSHYALVEASGYYWNELYGMKTTNPLSLKAVVHIEKNSTININVGTHITHKRILSLVESGMDFDKAKSQAESEIVKAFFDEDSGLVFDDASIFDDEKLLALSVLMLMAGPEPDVTEMIASLAAGVTDDLLVKLADKAALRYNDYAYARKNMETQFPNATVGHFEKYVYGFWQRVYGLGECSKENSGALDTVRAEKSANDGKVVICKDVGSDVYLWKSATDVEKNTASYEPVEDGSLIYSELDSSVAYVYDGGRWRNANLGEISMGKGCVKAKNGSVFERDGDEYRCDWLYCFDVDGGYMPDGSQIPWDSTDYICRWPDRVPGWKKMTILDYEKESYFNADVKYETVKDERDGQVYRTVEIDGKTWMAENLAYGVSDANCADIKKLGCRYAWRVAMNFTTADTVESGKVYRGVCMENWHVPDTTEWNSLLQKYDVKSLKSEKGWKESTNETGFSAIPLFSTYTNFIAANSIKYPRIADLSLTGGVYGYAAVLDSATAFIKEMSQSSKDDFRYTRGAIRCVKDSE